MTMKVTMSIKGDAIIYEKNDAWNVTFITDECHKLNFSADGVLVGSLRKAGVTRSLIVTPENPTSPKREMGTDFDKILNLNHHSLHGLNSGKSNLAFEQNSGSGRELIHMTVPVGTATGENLFPYWYAEYPNGQRYDLDHDVARTIKITFELNDGAGLKIELTDPSGTQTYEYAHKKNLDLDFNNDCQETSIENDFLHYYDWVRDKRSTPTHSIRFTAGKRYPPGSAPMSATLNCDPTSVWPAPEYP